MKVSIVKNEKKESPLQTLLKKVKGYKWAEDDDAAELIKKVEGDPDPTVPETVSHAGDLKPGQVGVDSDGTAYLGCQSAGAYNLDGQTRWLPNCGPEVIVHNIGEVIFVEDGAAFPEEPEEDDEPEEEDKYEPLLAAARSLAKAVEKRLDKGGSAKVDSALDEINKLIGE